MQRERMRRASFQCVHNLLPSEPPFSHLSNGANRHPSFLGPGQVSGKVPQVCSVGLRTLHPSSQRKQTLLENFMMRVAAWLVSGARTFTQPLTVEKVQTWLPACSVS